MDVPLREADAIPVRTQNAYARRHDVYKGYRVGERSACIGVGASSDREHGRLAGGAV
jgi:hypothetical protein